IFDRNVSSLGVACFIQPEAECAHHMCEPIGRCSVEETNDWFGTLLRARRQRPRRRRAADERDELAPPQVEHQTAPALALPPVSLSQRQPAAESPASPWDWPESS